MFHVISWVGIPKEILTDQGTNLSRRVKELYGLLNIKAICTSVYHPATDGFNRTVKSMIRKFVHKDARNRHQWLDPLFIPGDKVLVLLPTSSTKLLAKWQGPFVVTRRVGDVDYEVVRSDRGDRTQIYHINLLKV